MSDNYNDKSGVGAGSDEAQRRAERIKAIKKSVSSKTASGSVKLEERPSEAAVKASDTDEWEAGLAERISRHSSNVRKNKGMSLESILSELDGETVAEENNDAAHESADEGKVPEESAHEYVPKHEAPPAEPVNTSVGDGNADNGDNSGKNAAVEDAASEGEPKKKKKKKKKKKPFKRRMRELLPMKGDSVWERIRKIVFLGSLVMIIVCGYLISDYYIDLWRSQRENNKYMDSYWDYIPQKPSSTTKPDSSEPDNRKVYTLLEGAKYFLNVNSDVVGVIRVEGTPINNPVMQSEDNRKYLNRKMSGRESRAGELFLDYRCAFDRIDAEGHLSEPNSDNLIIYGHNMKDEQMFGCIRNYERDSSFYGKHPVIELNSNYERYTYKIFSVFLLDAEDNSETAFDCWNKINFSDEDDFYEFVNEAKKRTIRNNDVDVKYGDQLVTLSTCNTLLGERGRMIVMGRLVREGEDPYEGTQNNSANPNIKWPKLFYTYRPSAKKYDPDAEFVPFGPDAQSTAAGEK